MQFYSNSINKNRKEKTQVKLSKVQHCQVQIIVTDDDRKSFYEEDFEEWNETVSLLYSSSDEEEDEKAVIESLSIKTNKDKFAPVVNPDYQSSPVEQVPIPPVKEVEQEQIVPISQPPSSTVQQQGVVSGLKRLLSISKKNKTEPTAAATTAPARNEDTQYHVLRIFSGNINVGAMFSTVAVTPDMNADQLLKLALQKFHIPLLDNSSKSSDGIEYYLTVKSMDSGNLYLSCIKRNY